MANGKSKTAKFRAANSEWQNGCKIFTKKYHFSKTQIFGMENIKLEKYSGLIEYISSKIADFFIHNLFFENWSVKLLTGQLRNSLGRFLFNKIEINTSYLKSHFSLSSHLRKCLPFSTKSQWQVAAMQESSQN